MIYNIKRGADLRNIEYSLTTEYLWKLFLEQNKKCKLSGIDICFPPSGNVEHRSLMTASLDRIDSSKGYIEGNVQWVHKHINLMKNVFSNEYFIEMCKQVVNNI